MLVSRDRVGVTGSSAGPLGRTLHLLLLQALSIAALGPLPEPHLDETCFNMRDPQVVVTSRPKRTVKWKKHRWIPMGFLKRIVEKRDPLLE